VHRFTAIIPAVLLGGSASVLLATQSPQEKSHDSMLQVYQPAAIAWKDGPASLAPGARVAVLEGDPSKEGPFTMRLRLPDGFKIPPHYHGGVEHITVLQGTFNVGMGEKMDPGAAKKMPTGAFGFWPAGMRHFAFTEGETILQLHGQGPWTITYVNPADDPRKK
jgi:quercetin dioxygenase-like cupin family protein